MSGKPVCGSPKRSGGPCTRPAGWGTQHQGFGSCKLHGGCMPGQVTQAARQMVDFAARRMLDRLGRPEPIGHPVVELLDIAAEAKAWKLVCLEQVDVLDNLVNLDNFGAEQARAMVRQYTEALDRCERMLVNLAKLDLEAKRFRLASEQAQLLFGAQERALGVLPPDQAELVRVELALELRDLVPVEVEE